MFSWLCFCFKLMHGVWPYTAPMTGSSLIFPGSALDGVSLFDLMEREAVSSAWGFQPSGWVCKVRLPRALGVDLKIVDEARQALPHDGVALGNLYVRGNGIISSYFKNSMAIDAAFDSAGWFGTRDVASIDSEGFLIISDRAKDLIKSEGEWISLINLENIVMGHPEVTNCAVIAVFHPKWDERPLLVVVPRGSHKVTKVEVDNILLVHVARWQLPDVIGFVEQLPLTATGKVPKLTLRQQFTASELSSGIYRISVDLGIIERVATLLGAVREMIENDIAPLDREYHAEVDKHPSGSRFAMADRQLETIDGLKALARAQSMEFLVDRQRSRLQLEHG